jgi:hypothetical protein
LNQTAKGADKSIAENHMFFRPKYGFAWNKTALLPHRTITAQALPRSNQIEATLFG